MGGSFQQTMELMTPEHMMSYCKSSSPGPVNFRNDSDGDVDVLGPKNALLRAFPINDLGAQSLSSFQRSVGPVKPGGPFSTILRLPFVGAAKNHQWGPVSGCYDSFWPRILSVKRWIWTVNENCHNDSAPQQWPKLPMDSWGGCWPLSWRHKWWYFPDV